MPFTGFAYARIARIGVAIAYCQNLIHRLAKTLFEDTKSIFFDLTITIQNKKEFKILSNKKFRFTAIFTVSC